MLLSAMALLAQAAQPAPLATDPLTKDLHCLAATSALAGVPEADEGTKQGALVLATYYLGRIDGRAPNLDLGARLRQEQPKLEAMDMETLLKSCAAEAQARMDAVQKIGEQETAGK